MLPITILSCSMLVSLPAKAQGKVVIHGRVLTDEGAQAGLFEVLEVGNWLCLPLELEPNGHFELKLSVGDRAYLRFEQDGYLSKEVLVDTRNANLTRRAARKNKTLRFDVQMTPQLADKQLSYGGPVGIITYQKGTGLMKVKYDRSLVRKSNGDVVVLGEMP